MKYRQVNIAGAGKNVTGERIQGEKGICFHQRMGINEKLWGKSSIKSKIERRIKRIEIKNLTQSLEEKHKLSNEARNGADDEQKHLNQQNHHSLTATAHHKEKKKISWCDEGDANATALAVTCLGIILVQFDFHSASGKRQKKECQLKQVLHVSIS